MQGLSTAPVAAAGLQLVAPVNIGNDQHDLRVPDTAVLRNRTDEIWLGDAAIVVEVLSPHDESWKKLDHSARFGVAEIFIIDPETEAVQISTSSSQPPSCHERSAAATTERHSGVDWNDR
ncbi:MAG: Uma2 family endonuclease [Ilumatobacter sp.]